MATTAQRRSHRTARKWRTPLVVLAVARTVLGLLAIPLAPFLYEEHFVVLVLLRPTKEVLLAGGFLVRQGDVSLQVLLAATVPMLVLGVWLMFALGRAYSKEIAAGDAPGLGVQAGGPMADGRRCRGAPRADVAGGPLPHAGVMARP